MAPLVRTGGSRHTGLAAPPHRNIHPKYVLRTDEFASGNYEGIKTMHIADFLLSKDF